MALAYVAHEVGMVPKAEREVITTVVRASAITVVAAVAQAVASAAAVAPVAPAASALSAAPRTTAVAAQRYLEHYQHVKEHPRENNA